MKYVFLACLQLFTIVFASSAQKQLQIIFNSTSKYVIAVPGDATSVEKKAASVLQQYLKQITNCKLDIVSGENNNSPFEIIVGRTSRVNSSDTMNLGGDGILIRSSDRALILTGGSRKGVLYSVYTFLTDLGCDALTASDIEVPKMSTISLNWPMYKKQVPSFSYRMTHFIDVLDKNYCDWHKLNYFMEDWGLWVHSFNVLLPKDEYFAAHPEYFALVNGKRVPDQPDLTNPEVLKIVTANLKKMIDANPDAKYWSVSQNDNLNHCQCPNCKKLDDEQGSPQGSLLTFVNAVARQFPGKIITTLAYNYSLKPPKTLRPEKNVMIMLTTSHDRHIPIPSTPNDNFNTYFKKWATLTDKLFIWDYIVQFGNALSPFPNLNALQPNIQYFSDQHANYVFEQGIGNIRGEFSEMKTYLVSKLMWNKDINVVTTERNFINDFYGKDGARYIWKYIQLLNKNADMAKTTLLAGGSPRDAKTTYLSNANLDAYDALFNAALNATDTSSIYAKRIKKEYMCVLYARLENNKPSDTNFSATNAVNKNAYVSLLNKWYSYSKAANVQYLSEGRTKTEDYYNKYLELLK